VVAFNVGRSQTRKTYVGLCFGSAAIVKPSREGKRVLSIYLKPEAWKQLRMLAVNLEVPTQSLGEEAVNLLFEKHRLNRIA
jgi:antitoxin-like ribbon-helix-helix protein